MGRFLALGLASAAMLSGCVERPDPRSGGPLRQPASAEEAAYLSCVAEDPLFRTARCRALRAGLAADPTPGTFGR